MSTTESNAGGELVAVKQAAPIAGVGEYMMDVWGGSGSSGFALHNRSCSWGIV
jgi:hypothetical protein